MFKIKNFLFHPNKHQKIESPLTYNILQQGRPLRRIFDNKRGLRVNNRFWDVLMRINVVILVVYGIIYENFNKSFC